MMDDIFFPIVMAILLFIGFGFGYCFGYNKGGNDVLADWHKMRNAETSEDRP